MLICIIYESPKIWSGVLYCILFILLSSSTPVFVVSDWQGNIQHLSWRTVSNTKPQECKYIHINGQFKWLNVSKGLSKHALLCI